MMELTWNMFYIIALLGLGIIWLIWRYLKNQSIDSLSSRVKPQYSQIAQKHENQYVTADREKNMRQLLNSLPGMFATVGKDRRYIWANNSYLTHFGLKSVKDIEGRFIADILGPQNFERLKPKIDAVLNGEIVSIQSPLKLGNGEKHLDITYVPEVLQDGSVEQFYVQAVDVSPIHKVQKELEQSKEYLRKVLNSISYAVIATNEESKITAYNSVAAEWMGVDETQNIGRPFFEAFDMMSCPEKAPMREKTSHVFDVLDHMFFLRQANGQEIRISFSLTPIEDDPHTSSGAVIILRDITIEYETEINIRQNDRLKAIGRLSSGVSHNFNNLLAGITGSVELLKLENDGKWDTESAELADRILTICKTGAELSKKLMLFSKKSEQSLSPIDINTIIKEAVFIFSQTTNRNIEVVLSLNANRTWVLDSGSDIESAVLNLLINSANAMETGGKIHITTQNKSLSLESCRNSSFNLEPGEYVEITLSDTGRGIPDDIKDIIFEPFISTKHSKTNVGLGLSTVYGTVVDLRGAIRLESALGKGTTFYIDLPLTFEPDIPKVEVLPKAHIKEKLNILLVEDDLEFSRNIKSFLEYSQHDVEVAIDGRDAIEKFKTASQAFDLVILDINMPHINGLDVAKQIKEITPKLPIIISTGDSSDLYSDPSSKDLAFEVLLKPYSLETLNESISKLALSHIIKRLH